MYEVWETNNSMTNPKDSLVSEHRWELAAIKVAKRIHEAGRHVFVIDEDYDVIWSNNGDA